jgi:endonuclease/exonuclease/phosphatase family metal-dependent hydrolase
MRIFTYNIDWAKSNEDERASIRSVLTTADVILLQEAKHIDISSALNQAWLVHQNIKRESKQGVAVAWRNASIKRHRSARHPVKGYVLGVMPLGVTMLPRYFNWRDLDVPGHGTIRFVSTHRPPQRYRRLWPIFDRALGRFVKRSPHPVIVGMDSNERDHSGLERLTGLAWHGVGIDGFLVSRGIRVSHLRSHPRAKSDHHPISIEI